MSAHRPRRGIALAAALALITLVALLVAGGVASSIHAQRSVQLNQSDALVNAAAEYSLMTVLGDPIGYGLDALSYGERRTFSMSGRSAASIRTEVSVVRVRNDVLWLVAEGSDDSRNGGRRRLNLIARFPRVAPLPRAGLVGRGSVRVTNVQFDRDSSGEVDCAASGMSDVVVAPGSVVDGADSTRVSTHASANDSTAFYLTAQQQAALLPGPRVVKTIGDTTITGGTFDGILIVNGTLTITGPFAVTGLVVARGRIIANAGGFSAVGAIMTFAAQVPGVPAVEIDGGRIRFSPCAIERSLRTALPPKPVRQRAWAELF